MQKYYNIVEEVINMTLKELRLSKELTQSQVAKLVGISLRSYKEYENDVTKINTLKYNYIFNVDLCKWRPSKIVLFFLFAPV